MGHLRALLAASLHICLLTVIAAAQDQTLQLGTTIDRQLASGQSHTFTVILEENTYIEFVVEQRGIDVLLIVANPEGKELSRHDTPNGAQGPEIVAFVAATAGTYRITVAPLNQDTPQGQYQIKIVELREANEQEIMSLKNRAGIKEKGVALLAEADGLMQEIRSPQMRIKSQLQAAQMLWESDEKRAAKYLNDAATGLKELVAAVDPLEPEFMNDFSGLSQLRHEILQVLAARDPDAAISLLQATKLPVYPYSNPRDQAMHESALELMVADQFVTKDPKRAYEIARKKLKSGYSSSLINTISTIRQKNPELATELANEIAGKLLSEKLLAKPDAAVLALNLLHSCRKKSAVSERVERRRSDSEEGLVSEELCRDLFQKAYEDALSFSAAPNMYTPEREAAWSLLTGLQSFGEELNARVNGGLAAIEKKLGESTVAHNPYQGSFQKFQEKMSRDSPIEEVLAEIEKAPDETKEQLYLQLGNMTSGRGDTARARQIINDHIKDPFQRKNALSNLDQQEMYLSLSRGRVDEALKAISAIRSPRERANMLTQIAAQIGPGYKRAAAISMLEQARSLLAPGFQAQDQEQMGALLEIARAFSRYDIKRSFEIVDPLIEQLNELCTAAKTLEGFGLDYYKNDELEMLQGNNLANLSHNISTALATLAMTNFERAKITSDRLRLPEVRLRAYLEIARQAIGEEKGQR